MAYPSRLLAQGEEILYETRQHWVALGAEVVYTIIWLVLLIALIPWLDFPLDGPVMWALTGIWLYFLSAGVMRWHGTDFVLTTRRVIHRHGPFSKTAEDIGMGDIKDVGFRQSALQRVFGVGDLVLTTSGSNRGTVVRHIGDPSHLVMTVTETRSLWSPPAGDRPKPRSSSAPREVSGQDRALSRAEQLQILARLNNAGKLTDEEYSAEKARLLGSD